MAETTKKPTLTFSGPKGEIKVATITEATEPQGEEYVETAEGEIIPRGPIGQRSVYITPKGRIINLDLEGLPVQLGPKPKVIRVEQTSS